MKPNNEILLTVQRHAKEVEHSYPEHIRLFTALYGSQNYGLAGSNSDVDTKSFVLPPKDLVFFAPFVNTENKRIATADDLCCVKDIRKYYSLLVNPSFNYIEPLFTEYVDINPAFKVFYDTLVELREDIVEANKTSLLNSIIGMALSECKRFDKGQQRNKTYVMATYFSDMASKIIKGSSFCAAMECKDKLDMLLAVKYSDNLSDKFLDALMDDTKKNLDKLAKDEHEYPVNEKFHNELMALFNDLMIDYVTMRSNLLTPYAWRR